MSSRQQNQVVADLGGGFVVYVSRWPQRPGRYDEPKPPQVCWLWGNSYRYLPPEVARRFAAALVKAAQQAEGQGEERPGP